MLSGCRFDEKERELRNNLFQFWNVLELNSELYWKEN